MTQLKLGLVSPNDIYDYTNQFNTPLTVEEKREYDIWAAKNPGLSNKYDYDSQGFFKSGIALSANGHATDQYKKPNHPTFSDQSQYHGHQGKYFGGSWLLNENGKYTFLPSPTNLEMMPKLSLKSYFDKVEPTNNVILPLFRDYK